MMVLMMTVKKDETLAHDKMHVRMDLVPSHENFE
jgi:hypothetical protein